MLELQALNTREDARLNPIVQMARQLGLPVAFRERDQLDQLAEGGRHQGVLARVRERQAGDDNDLSAILDGLSVPPGGAVSMLVVPIGLLMAYGALRLSTTVFAELRERKNDFR